MNGLVLDSLRRGFAGQLLQPDDPGYDAARDVWNAMIDRRPVLICRCTSSADVAAAIRFARANDLEIGVRCGGHSVTGLAVPDGGLMIDLSPMQGVRVDPDRRRAWVQGGALLGNLDRATQQFGLATTAGNISHTGVGGLTLGGGMGWLARQCGLACDNVVSFEVVTAEGEVVRASATENPDLFWGLRGGGGNFGVVTEFEFRLHPTGTAATVVELYYDLDVAANVVRGWHEFIADAPRQQTLTAWVGTAGPWPFLSPDLHGRQLVGVGYVWVGDPAEGRSLLPAFRQLGKPVAERFDEVTYLQLQSQDDDVQGHTFRRYWKGHYLRELSDGGIDALLSRGVAGVSSGEASMLPNAGLQTHGGAIGEVAPDDTAFDHRDVLVEFTTSARWDDPAEDEARIAAVRRAGAAMEPYASGNYVNSLADEGQAGVQRAYGGDKLARLSALKARYDPDNVFHLNHNIRPSG